MPIQSLLLIISLLMLCSCGGGGSGSNSEHMNSGGTALEPAYIDLGGKNKISSDSSQNYFKYDAQAGETLYVYVTTTNTLPYSLKSSCARGIQYAYIDIAGDRSTCTIRKSYTFPSSGIYEIFLNYSNYDPSNNGYFLVDITGNSDDSPFSLLNDGSPDAPKMLSVVESNSLQSNPFYNYFNHVARKGEEITIDLTFDNPLDATDTSRCAKGIGGTIYINEVRESCYDGVFTHTFESDGIYTFSFINVVFDKPPNNSSGTFYASIKATTEPFFEDISSASLSTNYLSSDFAVKDETINISIDSGVLILNDEELAEQTTTAHLGDIINIKHLSSASHDTTVVINVTMGNASEQYTITTIPEPI